VIFYGFYNFKAILYNPRVILYDSKVLGDDNSRVSLFNSGLIPYD
jgi:hypothetical protein